MAYCINCGKELPEGMRFCIECGAEQVKSEPVPVAAATAVQEKPVIEEAQQVTVQNYEQPQEVPEPHFEQTYTVYEQTPPPNMPPRSAYQAPAQGYVPPYHEEPRPMQGGKYSVVGTGTYFGLMLLFSIPVIGFIACIIFACGVGKNENIRNYARANIIWSLISLVIFIIISVLIIAFTAGVVSYSGSPEFEEFFREFSQNPQFG